MSEEARNTLCRMIREHGRSLTDDPRRCEGLLRDLCPHGRREVHLLATALRERVPAELSSSQVAVPPAVLIARLTKRLEQDLGLAEEAARWAVESWALALGVVTRESLQPRPAAEGWKEPAAPAPAVPRDYYEMLGVDRRATAEQVRRTYQDLRRRLGEGNPAVARAAKAYEVLSDPEKRSRYDRFGHAGLEGGGPTGQPLAAQPRAGGKPVEQSTPTPGKGSGACGCLVAVVVLLLAGGGLAAYLSLAPGALTALRDRLGITARSAPATPRDSRDPVPVLCPFPMGEERTGKEPEKVQGKSTEKLEPRKPLADGGWYIISVWSGRKQESTGDLPTYSVRPKADLDRGIPHDRIRPADTHHNPVKYEIIAGPYDRSRAVEALASMIERGSLQKDPSVADLDNPEWVARINGRSAFVDTRGPISISEVIEYCTLRLSREPEDKKK